MPDKPAAPPTPIVLDADGNPRSIRPALDWKAGSDREWNDIRYETAIAGPDTGTATIAKITIARPEVRNAFRPTTLFELLDAFELGRNDPEVGAIILTGEGPEAFCSGGDQRIRGDDGYVGPDGIGRLNVLDLQIAIRRLPKPVVAMVAGLRDRRRPHPPHRVRPHRRGRQRPLRPDRPARRLVRRRLRLGPARPVGGPEEGPRDLVPVPPVRARRKPSTWGSSTPSCRSRQLEEETVDWCRRMLAHSPLALRMIKASCNAADDGLAGIQQLAGDATLLYYMTEEAQEGKQAYLEKRRPEFDRFPHRP